MAKKRNIPSIASIYASKTPLGQVSELLKDEPMVDEQMGQFGDIRVPVAYFKGTPQYWGTMGQDLEYVTPQTQEEHNRLLNTYYAERKTNPQWKMMGQSAEKASPHYTDKDATIRKDIGARSSVVQDIGYDKTNGLAMLKMGGKWYTYSATPEQFKTFLSAGSLGREMNNIRRGKGISMTKTSARKTPHFKSNTNTIANIFGSNLFGV